MSARAESEPVKDDAKTVREVRGLLRKVRDTVDVGIMDEHLVEVDVWLTRSYIAWLEKNPGDVQICCSVGDSSRVGNSKFFVQELINQSITLVETLLQAGVPPEVALTLLPREIYDDYMQKRQQSS